METRSRASGICVIYQKNEVIAERMRLVRPIIRKYIADNGVRLDRNSIYFLGISGGCNKCLYMNKHRSCTDYQKLKAQNRRASVFVTDLNSTSCQYLINLFFQFHPESVLISSASTAASLRGVDNFLRYQVPDVSIQQIYLHKIQTWLDPIEMNALAPSARTTTGNCIIIYQPGIYYQDLSAAIAAGAAQAGIATLRLPKAQFDLAELNAFADPRFSLIFVIDDPFPYIQMLRLDPGINQKQFQILISDAGAQILTSDPLLLAYLDAHYTQVIQFFIRPRQLLLAATYEAYIHNPAHPVSPTLALLFVCFDWAVLVANTKIEARRSRLTYLDLYLDANSDNTDTVYGAYRFIPDALMVQTFYYIYGTTLYQGDEVLSPSRRRLQVVPELGLKSEPSTSLGLDSFCQNVGLCVIYDDKGYAAERSFEVKRMIQHYIDQTGTRIQRNYLTYLTITGDPEIDKARLQQLSRKVKVFVSALGTGRVNYLAQIFFNYNLDCLHLNSFSTAASLSPVPNLARYQTPDQAIVRVYLAQIERLPGNCVVVYGGGIYSTDLSLQITAATTAAGISTLRILERDLTPAKLNEFTTDYFSIVYILDLVISAIRQLQSDPVINQKTFQILISDSAALNTTSDPELLAYLNLRDARLIQTFISERQLALAAAYEAYIHNPEHPVSTLAGAFLATFDWAVLVTNTQESHRLTRQTYQDLELDRFLNNIDTVYGAYRYVPDRLELATFFFIYAETLYRGVKIT